MDQAATSKRALNVLEPQASQWCLQTGQSIDLFLFHSLHVWVCGCEKDSSESEEASSGIKRRKKNKIRGLARYNNPKTSFLAPDPTGRIMWYKYRACVAEHTKSELSLQNSCFSFPIRDNGVVPQTCFSSQAVSIHWKLERNLSKRKLQTQDKVLAGRPIKKYYKMPHDIMHR